MTNAPMTAKKLHNQLLLFERARGDEEWSDSVPFIIRAARERLAETYGLKAKEEPDRKHSIIGTVGVFMAQQKRNRRPVRRHRETQRHVCRS